MRRPCSAATVIAVLFASPAWAQDPCVIPYSPTVPKGETATQEQINAVREEVRKFIATSDQYQTCLNTYITQQQDIAQRERRLLEPTIRAAIVAKGDANQREKERVGNEFNAALRAFRTANPAP